MELRPQVAAFRKRILYAISPCKPSAPTGCGVRRLPVSNRRRQKSCSRQPARQWEKVNSGTCLAKFLTKGRVQTFFPSALKFAATMTIRIRNRAAPKAAGKGPNAPADGLQQGRAYPAAPRRALANTYWGLYAYHAASAYTLRTVAAARTRLHQEWPVGPFARLH